MLKRLRIVIIVSILLLGAVLAINFLWKSSTGDAEYSRALEDKMSEVIRGFDEDYIQLLMKNRPYKQVSFLTLNTDTEHAFYLFSPNGTLVYWSDITMIPAFEDFVTNRKYQLIENKKGVYFSKLRKITRNSVEYWVLQVYPLIDHVEIENEYLSSGINRRVFGNDRFALSQETLEGYSRINHGKEYLFSVFFRVGYEPSGQLGNSTLLVFFFSLLGLVVLLGGSFIRTLWMRGSRLTAIFYTALILMTIRVLMIFFSFPRDFFDTELFSPSQYASSSLNPSLGDLFLNMVCVATVLMMLFTHWGTKRVLVSFRQLRQRLSESWTFVLALLLSKLCLALFFGLYLNIVQNAQWNLNIQALPNFNVLKGIGLVIVFMGGMIYFLFTVISINMVLYKGKVKRKRALNILLYISLPVAAYLFFADREFLIAFLGHFILVAVVVGLHLYKNIFQIGLDAFLTFFFGCLIGAVIIGAASYHHTRMESVQAKRNFADYVMLEDDIMGNYLLGEVMENIRGDLFIKNRMADPLLSKDPVEQKIKKIYLTNYLDNFVSAVRVFNRSGESLTHRETSLSLDEYRSQYMNSDFSTPIRNLYYVKGAQSGSPNKFIAFISMYRDANFIGTIMLELTQQRIMANSVFPKLLVDRQYASSVNDQWLDYAVFDEEILQFSSGVFNYRLAETENLLLDPKLYTTGVVFQGYHHVAIQGEDKIVMVSSPVYSPHYAYADVAMFFVVFLLLTLVAVLVYTLFFGLDRLKFNYATKLQFYLNFAFFFPMVVISVIAVGFLSRSYIEDLHRQYFDKALIIRDNLAKFMEVQPAGIIDRDGLIDEIYTLAAATNIDVNIYMPTGRLMASNQPRIFEKMILSDYINPRAYHEIIESQNNQILLQETVGNLSYKTVYLGLRDAERQQIQCVIAIPFFESEEELNELIADVVSNILIIFMVMFIVFLTISYFISKHLTFPFKLLTQKLKITNLESNEYMHWPAKDEIGLLVNEYNNMLSKLEASKKVLASNEKESAWREMAKQVAHEIKNPLTPMKLTLQHLLRIQAEGRLDDPDKLKKPISTLIHQVDVLSDIATSFSTFAKMPLPENEQMDFRKVVCEAIELYANREDVRFTFVDLVPKEVPLTIMGDPKLFGRVISNLIINGIQAVEKPRQPEIQVALSRQGQEVMVEIRDNGKGVPEELKDKIFLPNFSTKSEGSGLGLAIAKRGVETAGGRVWFKTKAGEGTSFFLAFPLLT
ncbi:MAG: GHKL domain-containing protein [Lunatimonas sp.]|uniref:sensor histidine kinase n=1 Tax=Lunatimonas sp. TaxID=2060141 RepID=UPI00263B47ED|nr:ATP-binding protein [Lunatimonas sp.]MCC5935984.1 GHKL domain-containing protein [Lunatimonas sp.]